MKRIILLSLLAIALFGTNLNAQTACENFKKSEQIRDGLPLGENRNFMIQIVLYWSKRCACESGAITGGTWDYTVEIGNRVYDDYINGKLTSYQGKYTGPPFPAPDRRMSVNDCKNDNNFNINIDASDCLNNKFDNSKDPQQFGNSFLLAKCECEKGVPTEQKAKELEATMKLNYDNAKKYYGSSFVLPQPLSYTACPIIQFGGVQSNTNQPQVNLVYTGYESNAEKFRDEYIKTFSTPNEFNAYASGMNVKRVGEALAKDLSNNLKQIQGLVNTTDPLVLLQDFNQKVTQIESLEANFNEQYNSYSFQTGQQLGSSIGNKDYESAFFQGMGLLNASLEKKEAQKQLEAQKQALYEERRSQMSAIYWKAMDYNNAMKQNYIKRAAFSEKLEDEKFNLAFVENLECHNASMKNNFSVSNTAWLENKCLIPKKTNVSNTFPTGTSKDIYYLNLAEHKYKQFEKLRHLEFQKAAIHFSAQAINIKPTAEAFAKLAKYYNGFSDIYELSNYLTAQSYNKNVLNKEQLERLEFLKSSMETHLYFAVTYNNLDYLKLAQNIGFDEIFTIGGKSLLDYAIKMDCPESVLFLLNKKLSNYTETKKQEEIKRTLALIMLYDSHETFSKFYKSEMKSDFKFDNMSILEFIHKSNAKKCLKVLIENDRKYEMMSHFFDGYAIFKEEGLFGCIDSSGNVIIPANYKYLRFPTGGIIIAIDKNQKYGALDLRGNTIIPFNYNYLGDCVEDKLIAKDSKGKFGYLDRNANIIISFKYDYAENFNSKIAKVGVYKSKVLYCTIINSKGEEICDYSFNSHSVKNLNNGLARGYKKKKWVIIDENGNSILPNGFDINYHHKKIFDENENIIIASNTANDNELFFYTIETKKSFIKTFGFNVKQILIFNNAIVVMNEENYKTHTSNEIHFLMTNPSLYFEKFKVEGNNSKYKIFDFNGIEKGMQFIKDSSIRNNKKVRTVRCRKVTLYNEKEVDSYGYTIIPHTLKNSYHDALIEYFRDYQSISVDDFHDFHNSIAINDFQMIVFEGIMQYSEGLVAVRKNGKWGFVDEQGKTIIPFIYEGASYFSNGVALVVLEGKRGYIDKAGNFFKNDLNWEPIKEYQREYSFNLVANMSFDNNGVYVKDYFFIHKF